MQTTLGKIWTQVGKTLQVKVKQGYQNFYACSAVSPQNGESFSLFLPWVNTEMMNLYLTEFSNEYSGDEVVIIMDQAGWHKANYLVIPHNITLLFLPPYSPDLNPVERLWKYLKNNFIHNRLFNDLSNMMNTLTQAWELLDEQKIKKLCSCDYLCL